MFCSINSFDDRVIYVGKQMLLLFFKTLLLDVFKLNYVSVMWFIGSAMSARGRATRTGPSKFDDQRAGE